MDKKIAGLLAAAGALASLNSAQAATADPTEMLKVQSYADLLDPIPNASAVLEAVDSAAAGSSAHVQVAQFFEHHHHHHHHHGFYRGYGDEPRVIVVPQYRRFYRDHHHHHHHHHNYYRRYRDDD